MRRTYNELVDRADDALPLIQDCVRASAAAEVLPRTDAAGARTIEALQITTRSPLGAIAYHTGGILIDGGWLRILGAGSPRLPRSLDEWNGIGTKPRFARGLLIADDAGGGFFAWFAGPPRTVHYLAPDTLQWEDSKLGYGDWLQWAPSDRLAKFYEGSRWSGWKDEVSTLGGDRCIFVYPPAWAQGPPLGERHRGPVPIDETWRLAYDESAVSSTRGDVGDRNAK